MTPETAQRLMRRFESGHPMTPGPGPGETLDVGKVSGTRLAADQMIQGAWEMLPPTRIHAANMWLPGDRIKVPRMHASMSDARARIAAMNHDAVSAALWALASFDPALAQLAELREHFLHVRKLDEEDPLRITLDRLVSVYVEGQCRELLNGAEITTDQANLFVEQRIIEAEEAPKPDEVAFHILACTSDPLAMELNAYALWLGSLTAHGTAPWKRFASTMADCYYKRHPLAS